MQNAIGFIESNSIAVGVECVDAMAKRAAVTVLFAKPICPGKYIVMVTGDVAAVNQSIAAGLELCPEAIVDHFVIPNPHPDVFPAIGGGNVVDKVRAVGVIETYSAAATIEATDIALKAAMVTPIRMHLAFGIGGKAYIALTGDVADVKTAVAAGAASAGEKGMLARQTVIPRPNEQLINSLL